MRRRSILAGGVAGAAALVAGAVTSETAHAATTAAAAPSSTADVSWANSSLRQLADPLKLKIGTALTPQDIETASYAAIAGSQFSVVTAGNAMKWDAIEPTQGTYNFTGADELVNFAAANDQLVRGHNFVWHNQLPGWLTSGVAAGTITKTQIWDALEARIFAEAGRYKGKIWQWDVTNEFFTDANPSGIDPNNWWVVNAGADIIPQAYKWARQADPKALLFLNEYNNVGEDGNNAKFQAIHDYIQQQRDAGVPIDGVGCQCHVDTQYGWSPERMRQDLEAYAALGLKIAVTEADVRTFVTDATTQAPTSNLADKACSYQYSEMVKAALSVPEVISFTVWGFTDTDSWVPGTFKGEGYACIYDVNQQPKSSYYAIQADLANAAYGAPKRVQTYWPKA
jgi:endo-1,4-beta-xylanase